MVAPALALGASKLAGAAKFTGATKTLTASGGRGMASAAPRVSPGFSGMGKKFMQSRKFAGMAQNAMGRDRQSLSQDTGNRLISADEEPQQSAALYQPARPAPKGPGF